MDRFAGNRTGGHPTQQSRWRAYHRENALRRVRGVTTWVTAGAATLAVALGGVFAASRALAANDQQNGTGTQQSGPQQSGGGSDDGGQNSTQQNQGNFQPPAQNPGFGGRSGSHTRSGGS